MNLRIFPTFLAQVAQHVTQVVDIALRRRLLVVIWYACTRRGFVMVTTIVEIEVTRQNSSVVSVVYRQFSFVYLNNNFHVVQKYAPVLAIVIAAAITTTTAISTAFIIVISFAIAIAISFATASFFVFLFFVFCSYYYQCHHHNPYSVLKVKKKLYNLLRVSRDSWVTDVVHSVAIVVS